MDECENDGHLKLWTSEAVDQFTPTLHAIVKGAV